MVTDTPPNTETTAPAGFGAVLRSRAFLAMWVAQAISQVGQNIINIALLVAVNSISRSSTAVSGIIIAFALPGVIFSSVAGVLVDRADKRTVMIAVNLLRAVATVGFVLASGLPVGFALIGIYVLGFTFAAVTQFFNPAEGAAIPFVVRKGELAQANALFQLTITVSQLIGFATLGPLLIALIGLNALYVVIAISFVICAGMVALLPSMRPMVRPRDPDDNWLEILWLETREAWVYILRDRLLRKAMGFLTFASAAFLALGVLAQRFADETLQLGASGVGTILAPAGVGMVIGVVIVGRLARPENRETMIHGGTLSQGVTLLIFGLAPVVFYGLLGRPPEGEPLRPLVIAVMLASLCLGVGQAFILVPSQTLLLERSGEEVRARVMSTFFTLSNASALVPTLGAGLIGDTVGVTAGVLTLAVAALLLGAGGVFSQREHDRRQQATPE